MTTSSPPPSSPKHRTWSAADKARLLRRHVRDGVPIADLAEEAELAPSQLHCWLKTLLERADLALADRREKAEQRLERACAQKDARIRHLEEVTAELSMEVLQLKKARGAT